MTVVDVVGVVTVRDRHMAAPFVVGMGVIVVGTVVGGFALVEVAVVSAVENTAVSTRPHVIPTETNYNSQPEHVTPTEPHPNRIGRGTSPRICHTVDATTLMPSTSSSPWMRR